MPRQINDIAIVGGGFSGIATAYQVAKLAKLERRQTPLRITVYEKNELGGLAYGHAGKEHFTNIPPQMMSIDPDNPNDLFEWAEQKGFGDIIRRNHGVPRYVYKQYITDRLYGEATADIRVRFRQVQEEVVGIRPAKSGFLSSKRIAVRTGSEYLYDTHEHDAVVLATGHLPPSPPREFIALMHRARENGAYVSADMWQSMDATETFFTNAHKVRRRKGNVLVIGSGLTAFDHVMTAENKGYFRNGGKMTLVSRHGKTHETVDDFDKALPKITHQDLERFVGPLRPDTNFATYITQALNHYKNHGFADWQTTLSLMPLLTQKGLPLSFRVPLDFRGTFESVLTARSVGVCREVGDVVARLMVKNQLEILRGDLFTPGSHPRVGENLAKKVFMLGNGYNYQYLEIPADAVFLALPRPAHYKNQTSALYRTMAHQGTINFGTRTDRGFVVDDNLRVLDTAYYPVNNLFAIGAGMTVDHNIEHEGKFGAHLGNVPTLRQHAKIIAQSILVPN